MSASIEQAIRSVMDGQRADYLFATKIAAEAVGCVPNKFGDWWSRTESKLTDLYARQPTELATHFMLIVARAEARKKSRGKSKE